MKDEFSAYPILVPVKKMSKRLPGKNRILLDYTLDYLKEYKENRVILLTDDDVIINKYENTYDIIYDNYVGTDVLESINEAVKTLDVDNFFYVSVTSPFKEHGLLHKMFDLHCKFPNINMITSKVCIPNRKIFLLDEHDKFIHHSPCGRKGKFVQESFMIDGAVYFVNSDFLNEICQTDIPNKLFWETDFKTVLNNVPFFDIDTQSDLDKFYFYKNFKYYE